MYHGRSERAADQRTLSDLMDSRMRRPGYFHQIEDAPVIGREDVEMVGRHQRSGGRAGRRGEAGVGAGPRINGLNLARFLDRNMHEAARPIEEGRIRRAAKRPLGAELAGGGAERDKRTGIAGDIEAPGSVIDVESMRTW